ncbi:MAG: addiction module protein [Propionibacteriaceae bacterium]|jgi:hypothetical protein|nr:addiction module protein [Propionibacteriaceae bacterium]
MSLVAEVERALLALAPQDRAAVIERGIVSLDDDGATQGQIDAAWRDVLRGRIDDIERGGVELVSGEESEARVQALLEELRR